MLSNIFIIPHYIRNQIYDLISIKYSINSKIDRNVKRSITLIFKEADR